MSTITNSAQLKAYIQLKKIENVEAGQKLKNDFFLTYESFKPLNIIKNTLKQVFKSEDIQSDIISSGISLAANYASSMLAENNKPKPVKNLLSNLSQMALTAIANNPETFKSIGSQIIDLIFRKNKSATK